LRLPEVKREKGRIGVFEVLEMTPQLEQLVMKSLSDDALTKEARRQGMTTMLQDGLIKALGGLVSIKEVMRVVQD